MVVLGALVGVAAAVLAQAFGSVFARRRDREAAARRAAARMLAHGRIVQMRVHNARVTGSEKGELVEHLAEGLAPFVGDAYELTWLARDPLRKLATTYQHAVQQLIEDWDVQREGFLDDEMTTAANALDDELARLTEPRRARRLWRRAK